MTYCFGLTYNGVVLSRKPDGAVSIGNPAAVIWGKRGDETETDENKIFLLNDFDQDKSMKVSHGKKQHVIVKII